MRRVVAAFLVLGVWIAGSALGTAPGRRDSAAAAPLFQIEQAHAGYVPTLDGDEPIFVLLIGSDARPDQAVAEQRADSIHILAINPAKGKATILGFPRDSWVAIPGRGTNKINTALFYGGPELVVQTVEGVTGITIDYWALTGFAGFDAMVDQIGGLTMDVPFAMSDPYSKAEFQPGVQELDGRDALAFARNRHDLPQGDFGRSENQGRLMVAALAQFGKEFAKDPSRLVAWIAAGLRNMQTDVPLEHLLQLAYTASTLNPRKVQNLVVPGSSGMVGGTSIVTLSSQAETIYRDLANDGLVTKKNAPPSPNQSLLS